MHWQTIPNFGPSVEYTKLRLRSAGMRGSEETGAMCGICIRWLYINMSQKKGGRIPFKEL